MKKQLCEAEDYEYEFRTYYYCQRIKGHKGQHSVRSIHRWK